MKKFFIISSACIMLLLSLFNIYYIFNPAFVVTSAEEYTTVDQYYNLNFELDSTVEQESKIYCVDYESYKKNEIAVNPTNYTIPIDELVAIEIAKEFFAENNYSPTHTETAVREKDDLYYVYFINTIDGMKCFGNNDCVIMDKYGNVKSAYYYNVEYIEIETTPIISMQEAYYKLPAVDTEVNLTDCELVYIYDESILQTAYLFTGQTANGEFYYSFVKANIYD